MMELLSVAYALGVVFILGVIAEMGIRRLPKEGEPLPSVTIPRTG